MAEPVENWLRRHAPIEASGEIPDGTVMDGWRVAALVARGGSGEVYRAVHVETGRVAALKILHRDDDAARARFALEVSILSENRGLFLPAFYGAGEYKGRPWCAMEFLNPFSLPSGDGAVASFVADVCRGVGALHALGYVHRDIKPSNILSRNGDPVLIDLGLLKNARTPVHHVGGTLSVVDGRPVGVGTPGYAAPEQFLGGKISPAADIHAIGVLASMCFGGRPPAAWRKIIRRATSSLPDERYPDVACVRFRYRCHFAGEKILAGTDLPRSLFDVSEEGKTFFEDREGDADEKNPLGDEKAGQFDVPEGHHRLRFRYSHNGTGYIDHFNGVHLLELRIEPGTGK